MEIKRSGLFFKFLNMFREAYDLDNCKVVKLILKNLVLGTMIVISSVIFGSALGGLMFSPFVFAANGFMFTSVFTAMIIYGFPFFVWYLATRKKSEPKEPSVIFQLYDSWKNKYCIKVEVV